MLQLSVVNVRPVNIGARQIGLLLCMQQST